jgi:hypothetical protein
LHTSPGLGSYLSEVDRFALDMRKRSTIPTDCRYIDARVAESVTTASTSRRRRPHHRAPRHRAARAPFRDPHPTHRDDGSMGPSTDISRSRTSPARLTDQIASPPRRTAPDAYQTALDNLTRTTGLAA